MTSRRSERRCETATKHGLFCSIIICHSDPLEFSNEPIICFVLVIDLLKSEGLEVDLKGYVTRQYAHNEDSYGAWHLHSMIVLAPSEGIERVLDRGRQQCWWENESEVGVVRVEGIVR